MINEVNKIGIDPEDGYSDMPVNWNCSDLQMGRKWDENTIREFMGLPPTFIAIYKSIIDVGELHPRLAGGEEGEDWDEFRMKTHGFPPIVVVRTTTDKLKIADGNHRVYWAEQSGYRTIGAWVVDKLIQKDINRRNKRLTETRIITPEESLYEGYITLYHGTTWPIALKAKKGELGPQNLENLVVDVLVNVFHEDPKDAHEYYKKYSGQRKKDPKALFFTTKKEQAEMYSRSTTKYGGEIFFDVLSKYFWDKNKDHRKYTDFIRKLKTDEPAVITINVPLSMVLTHPHWITPAKDRIRDILKVIRQEPDLKDHLGDMTMEVFVKENIPARFVQRIDKVTK